MSANYVMAYRPIPWAYIGNFMRQFNKRVLTYEVVHKKLSTIYTH